MYHLRLLLILLPVTGLVKGEKIDELRVRLAEEDLAAYIVPNSDAHGSEVPTERDKRREWLTGFTGSWGDAVVGRDWAALFTDSRYSLQARRQLSQHWQVYTKQSENITNWLSQKLSKGDKIGIDPKTISSKLWLDIEYKTNPKGIELIPTDNFIDDLWLDRPTLPEVPIFIHDIKYTVKLMPRKKLLRIYKKKEFGICKNCNSMNLQQNGKQDRWFCVKSSCPSSIPLRKNYMREVCADAISWNTIKIGGPGKTIEIDKSCFSGQNYSCKVGKVREKMSESKTDAVVLSSLEDVAWLLNLRGGDSPHTPVFSSFLILTQDDGRLYVRPQLLTPEIASYLNGTDTPFSIKDIDEFWNDWNETAKECSRCFVPNNANYFIYSAVPDDKRKTGRSPVVDLRAYKTAAEVASSRVAHISDAIALCQLFMMLEEKIDNRRWREREVSKLVGDLREEQPENRGRSFPDIVAAGGNAALPHYHPREGHDSPVNTSSVILIDSGGQYLGGTTDTTRVLHLGKPREVEVDVYSRLLRGVARLGAAVFPEGSQAKVLDSILRAPLYEVGLGYGHGSTHGTGVFLAVHEEFNGTYYENFIGSQEPGFYEENDFGMRLENLVVVVPAETFYKNKTEKRLLKFSPLTLVPYERKLIDASIFDESELKWINDYHQEVLKTVGGEIQKRGDHKLYQWLVAKTAPIVKK